MNRTPARAIVIGSGFGGLAAAVRLRARGYAVTVLERRDVPGGRASSHQQDGFHFDHGPTVITWPQLFRELWTALGERMDDHVTLLPVAPLYRFEFPGAARLDYTQDPAALRAQVAAIHPPDAAGFDRLVAATDAMLDRGVGPLLDVPMESVGDLLQHGPRLLRLGAWKSLHGQVCQHLSHPINQAAFSFHPLFIGCSPLAMGTAVYGSIHAIERRDGVSFPAGGTAALVSALVALVERHGVQIRYDAEVSQLECEGRRATGVRLANGEVLHADIVVSNADSSWTYRKLVPSHLRSTWTDKRLERARYSMGVFVWYFGTNRVYDRLAHHTVVFGPRFEELIRDIFDRKVLADDMCLYLHRPTATDPSLAPEGCDTFYVLSPVPHLDANVDWALEAPRYRDRIAERLERTVMPGLRKHLVTESIMTPMDFRTRLLASRGAAFGLEPVLTQAATMRPHNRSEDVQGLCTWWAREPIPAPACQACWPRPRSSSAWCQPLRRERDTMNGASPVLDAAHRHDLDVCLQILSRGSKSFATAGKLLPQRVRLPAAALYAFCRVADDAIDDCETAEARAEASARIEERLDLIYAGSPVELPVDRAFARVAEVLAIPKGIPAMLLEGSSWDIEARRYATLPELRAYCVRVASTVGVAMTLLMGERDHHVLARAADLGVAMQLTNIARDVGEDARAGRLYLPLDWMAEVELDPDAFLRQPRFDHRVARLVQRLLDEADLLYRRAEPGILALPADCQIAIRGARLIYAAIGDELRRQGYDSIHQRAVVPLLKKVALLATAAADLRTDGPPGWRDFLREPAVPEAMGLLGLVDDLGL